MSAVHNRPFVRDQFITNHIHNKPVMNVVCFDWSVMHRSVLKVNIAEQSVFMLGTSLKLVFAFRAAA